jgi:hypothetical protein
MRADDGRTAGGRRADGAQSCGAGSCPVGCYAAAGRAAGVAVTAGWAAAESEDRVMAAGRSASAEDVCAVVGYEQSEGHRTGRGKPLSPGRSGLVDVDVERDAVVRSQPRARRLCEQVIEPGGEFGWVLGGEHRCQRGPGVAGIGQITITDRNRFRLLMCQQKRAQVVRAGQGVAVPLPRSRVHQRDRQAGPPGWPEGRLCTHERNVTA